jgi:ribosomal protein S6E (S10)
MRQSVKGRWRARTLTAVEGGYTTDRHGPRVEEVEGLRGNRGSEERPEILINIVAIRRDNVF